MVIHDGLGRILGHEFRIWDYCITVLDCGFGGLNPFRCLALEAN